LKEDKSTKHWLAQLLKNLKENQQQQQQKTEGGQQQQAKAAFGPGSGQVCKHFSLFD